MALSPEKKKALEEKMMSDTHIFSLSKESGARSSGEKEEIHSPKQGFSY